MLLVPYHTPGFQIKFDPFGTKQNDCGDVRSHRLLAIQLLDRSSRSFRHSVPIEIIPSLGLPKLQHLEVGVRSLVRRSLKLPPIALAPPKPTPDLPKLPACGVVIRSFCCSKLKQHPTYLHYDTNFLDYTKLLSRL